MNTPERRAATAALLDYIDDGSADDGEADFWLSTRQTALELLNVEFLHNQVTMHPYVLYTCFEPEVDHRVDKFYVAWKEVIDIISQNLDEVQRMMKGLQDDDS